MTNFLKTLLITDVHHILNQNIGKSTREIRPNPDLFLRCCINIDTVKSAQFIPWSLQIPGNHMSSSSSHSPRSSAASSCFLADNNNFPWADVLKGDRVHRKRRCKHLRDDFASHANWIAMAAFLVNLCNISGQYRTHNCSLHMWSHIKKPLQGGSNQENYTSMAASRLISGYLIHSDTYIICPWIVSIE